MSLLDDLKAKADVNGDGKITKEDLDAVQNGDNKDKLDQLKNLADQNDDGKIDVNDLKNFNLSDTINDLKDKIL